MRPHLVQRVGRGGAVQPAPQNTPNWGRGGGQAGYAPPSPGSFRINNGGGAPSEGGDGRSVGGDNFCPSVPPLHKHFGMKLRWGHTGGGGSPSLRHQRHRGDRPPPRLRQSAEPPQKAERCGSGGAGRQQRGGGGGFPRPRARRGLRGGPGGAPPRTSRGSPASPGSGAALGPGSPSSA